MPTVFFSWQRDTSPAEGRNFLERTLERAVAIVAAQVEVEEAVREELELDRDTKGVAGQPPIVETIFRKIDAVAVFVPDLTFEPLAKFPALSGSRTTYTYWHYSWICSSMNLSCCIVF